MAEKMTNKVPAQARVSKSSETYAGTTGLFKAGVAAALISTASVGMAQESTSIQDAYNTWCEQNKEMCSKYQVQVVPATPNYDAKTHTLFVPQKTKSTINQKNFAEFISLFDTDGSGTIEVKDIEAKFSIHMAEFSSLYSGSSMFIELNPEISKLLDSYNVLIMQKTSVSNEEDVKKIDREIFSLLKDIERKKTKYYVDYFDTLTKKINEVLSDSGKKVLFLSYIAKNQDLKEFYQFVVSNLSQESDDTLSKYQDSNYVSDVTMTSLVSQESQIPKTAFSEQERNIYALSFVRLKDVYNAKILAKDLNEANLFAFLSDINSDGKVSKEDKGVLYGTQLLSVLNDVSAQLKLEQNQEILYANIGYILNQVGVTQKINSKDELLSALSKDPTLKMKFQDAMVHFNLAGIDIAYVLKYGQNGVKLWNEAKQKVYNNPLVGKLVSKMKDKMFNIEQDLTKLKSTGVISDKEYHAMIKMVDATITKPGFEEKMFQQVVGMLSALSATYFSESGSLNGAKFSYSKNIFNAQNEKLIKKFVDKLELDLGVVNTQSGNMLMLGLAYKVDQNLSETDKLSYGFGARFGLGQINNVLPVLTLGYTKVTNMDDIKNAGLEEFDLTKNSFTGSVNYSMLNVNGMNFGLFAGYKNDRQGALETKFSEYSTLLDGLFQYEGETLEQFGEGLERKVNTQEFAKVKFLASSLLDQVNTLESKGFNTLSTFDKKLNIQIVKMQLLSKFLSYYASKEEEKGYGVSGFGLSLNILMKVATGGFPLLPGIEFSKMIYDYDVDQGKKTLSTVLNHTTKAETVTGISQEKLLTNLDKYIAVPGVKIEYTNGQIVLKNEGGENLFDSLAKAGVQVFLSPNEDVIGEVGMVNNTLIIGDVKDISVFVDSGKEGKKVVLLLGGDTGANKLKLTQESAKVLSNNSPGVVENVNFSHRNISLQNTGNLNTKKIGIFM